MFIQLSNKNVFDSMSINQITDQGLALDSGKIIPATTLEAEWILRVCGHLVYVSSALSFNMNAIVSIEDQLLTLRNGFTLTLTKDQIHNLKIKYEAIGQKILDLEARVLDLTSKGISKNDCQKL